MNETRWIWRGKRLNNGEWYQGIDVMRKTVRGELCLCNPGEDWISVDPSTLGECTGLTDKNGKLIFEGDIIDYENGDGIYTYMVAWDNEYSRFAIADNWFGETKIISDFVFYSPSKCTVIGNIHDNPELLKGEQNESILFVHKR